MVFMLSKSFILSVSSLFFLLLTGADSDGGIEEIKEKVVSLVKKWAPKIWLDSEEKFFPSNVSYFLNEVMLTEESTKAFISSSKLPVGKNSVKYFMTTKGKPDELLKNTTSFLYGTDPSKKNVSAYAFVKTCDPKYDHLIITYWFFFPFNEGKRLCAIGNVPVFKLFNKCLGKMKIFGNHVGDWEHVAVEIKHGTPTAMFLSVHDVGVYYKYDADSGSFKFKKDEATMVEKVQKPPHTVRVAHGHPILYSAKGSHALWAGQGSYQYTNVHIRGLTDAEDKGTPWETWNALKIFYSEETIPDWFLYEGRWGNPAANCFTKKACLYSDGPKGLAGRKLDFNCTSK